jgi:uncharacterized protein
MIGTRWLSRALLLLFLVTGLSAFAEKVSTMPAPTGYIDDYAGVISASANTELEIICNEVHNKTRAQIFLVTVKSTEGEEVQTFANELFAKWKIGEKKTDRGVLLLFAIDDHKRWIEVGYGLEGILNDAKVGDIGREMVADLKSARYDAATRIGVLQIAQIIAADAGVTLNESLDNSALNNDRPTLPEPASSPKVATVHGSPWLILLMVPLFLGPLVGFFVLLHFARKRGATGTSWTSDGSDSSGSGSFSSGSDDSFGGGDGGSSGGGGAGGDW